MPFLAGCSFVEITRLIRRNPRVRQVMVPVEAFSNIEAILHDFGEQPVPYGPFDGVVYLGVELIPFKTIVEPELVI